METSLVSHPLTITHIYFSLSISFFTDGWLLRIEYYFLLFNSPSTIVNQGDGVQHEQNNWANKFCYSLFLGSQISNCQGTKVNALFSLLILNCDNSGKLGKFYILNRKNKKKISATTEFSIPNPEISTTSYLWRMDGVQARIKAKRPFRITLK